LQKCNPLPEEIPAPTSSGAGESKRQSIFQEQLRAERESFKAVFDRRRQRIGLDFEED
jgi:YLP motif-containing protein 1